MMVWQKVAAFLSMSPAALAASAGNPYFTIHDKADCSDDQGKKFVYSKHFGMDEVQGCTSGLGTWHDDSQNVQMGMDVNDGECNATHYRMGMYFPDTACATVAGMLAVPLDDGKFNGMWKGECTMVYSECCDDGAWHETPPVEYVMMHNWVMEHPHCKHCASVPRSTIEAIEAKGFHVRTCEEARLRRRLQGLPEGPPCPKAKAKHWNPFVKARGRALAEAASVYV